VTLTTRIALTLGAGVILCAAAVFHVYGQSPSRTASVALDGRIVAVHYSAPSVRGRQIFGDDGLLSSDPTYPVWRAGANAATTLHTTGNIDIGGLAVPAGTYSLYVQVKNPDAWELIVNRETGQWGRSYDSSRDLGRVAMTMSTPPEPVEMLTYMLTDNGDGTGGLGLKWEQRAATVSLAPR